MCDTSLDQKKATRKKNPTRNPLTDDFGLRNAEIRSCIFNEDFNFGPSFRSLEKQLHVHGLYFMEAIEQIKTKTGDIYIDENMYNEMLKALESDTDPLRALYYKENGRIIQKMDYDRPILCADVYYRHFSLIWKTMYYHLLQVVIVEDFLKDQFPGYYIDKDYVYLYCFLWSSISRYKLEQPLVKHFFESVDINIDILPSDFIYKFIFSCQDQATKFIILKPLQDCDAKQIAAELYKIFLNFGIPSLIHTKEFVTIYSGLKLIDLKKISDVAPSPTIVQSWPKTKLTALLPDIYSKMSEIGCLDFSMGCQYFQWHYNFMLKSDEHGIPCDNIIKIKDPAQVPFSDSLAVHKRSSERLKKVE